MRRRTLALAVATVLVAPSLRAQSASPAAAPLEIGTKAPDFTLPSATRSGVGQPVHLRDLRGQTVVLAFFYKARTKG